MINVEETLRAELHRLVAVDARPDWDEIVARAGPRREPAMRRWLVAAAVAAAASVLAIATPLVAAIANGFDDFSAWLTGKPGAPVSQTEQREFEAKHVRSWLGFPDGIELRRLITRRHGTITVELFGFRSGASALCLKAVVKGELRASTLRCAPFAELQREGAPVRVVVVDEGFGKGEKFAWYGIHRVHSTALQITAGIAADGVRSVVLEDGAGRHGVAARSNAFLYVAESPAVGQRVKRIWARTPGGLVRVPFAPAPFGFVGGVPGGRAPAAPPVERTLSEGRIGWLDRRVTRGQALDVLPARLGRISGRRGRGNVVFGRVLSPDPDRPLRLVVTLNSHRPGGPVAGLCTWLVTRRGGGGGCSSYPGVFQRALITTSLSGDGSAGFVTVSGLASDHVARVEALLADGESADLPLLDNAFAVDLPRASLPTRLVAYDAEGRVIHAGAARGFFFGGVPAPARGRATSLFRVSGPDGTHAELFVGPATGGGECVFIKHFFDRTHRGVGINCNRRNWTGPAVQLNSQSSPPRFIGGRVRSDVKRLRIRFADGSTTTLRPKRGYVLYATSRRNLVPGAEAVSAEGVRADGTVAGRVSFKPPPRARPSTSP